MGDSGDPGAISGVGQADSSGSNTHTNGNVSSVNRIGVEVIQAVVADQTENENVGLGGADPATVVAIRVKVSLFRTSKWR